MSEFKPSGAVRMPLAILRYAQEIGLEVAIMDGTDLANLDSYLSGKDFKGTVIR